MIKIFIDKDFNIKEIGESVNSDFSMIEIDREEVFGDMTDFMVLNYKYISHEYGYTIYPARDYDQLVIEEKDYIIEKLIEENNILKKQMLLR